MSIVNNVEHAMNPYPNAYALDELRVNQKRSPFGFLI